MTIEQLADEVLDKKSMILGDGFAFTPDSDPKAVYAIGLMVAAAPKLAEAMLTMLQHLRYVLSTASASTACRAAPQNVSENLSGVSGNVDACEISATERAVDVFAGS